MCSDECNETIQLILQILHLPHYPLPAKASPYFSTPAYKIRNQDSYNWWYNHVFVYPAPCDHLNSALINKGLRSHPLGAHGASVGPNNTHQSLHPNQHRPRI